MGKPQGFRYYGYYFSFSLRVIIGVILFIY